MILIALMCARIPPSPDNLKGLLNTRLSRRNFIVTLNQWEILFSHLTLIMGRGHLKLSDCSND